MYSDNVTMGLLVNFSPGGEGIESVVSDNLTCSCDSVACTCLHYAHYRHTQHSAGLCDDHCILSLTILASLGMCSVLVLTIVTRKGLLSCRYHPAKTQELDLAEIAEDSSSDSYSSSSTYQYPHPVMVCMQRHSVANIHSSCSRLTRSLSFQGGT